jgi:eukaryotic-like serine/threonine-protein kinase
MPAERDLKSALENRYEVEREIGAGGMATVYLARDVRHKRKVALKVLKPELGAALGVERFLAEIQVTANLQHPNLLPLFDSGDANGLLYYVMPYVEGESLRQRINREKQLPIGEAVRIATAIAGALEYAHEHGVIHRDLKPENILLQSGEPVIADFGIALAISNAGGARITQTGLSLGTPQYMSPEQATSDRQIDGRTDIYSLGAITFEMLVGDPPHLGGTAQAVIAKVLTERAPSVRVARPSVGEDVAWAIERALEKLPADRWSTAREFADALQGRISVSRRQPREVLPAPTSTSLRALLAMTSVAAVLGAVAAVYFATRRTEPAVTGRFEVVLPESVSVWRVGAGPRLALSRDGTQLAIVGVQRNGMRALYVRALDDPVARLVRGSEMAQLPSFSPDGRWLLFKTTSALKKIPVTGGTAQTLADSVSGASWGDGDALVFTRAGGRELWLATPNGRDGRRIAGPSPSRRIYRYAWPEVLPGGTHALITLDANPDGLVVDSLRLAVVTLSDGSITELGVVGTNPHYAAPGRIVFGRAGGLVFSAPFSLRARRTTGTAQLLLENVYQASGGATSFAVSQTGGVLASYGRTADVTSRGLVIVDVTGKERAFPGDAARFQWPRVSPDGHHVAVAVGDEASEAVWIADVATGARTRLTPESTSVRPEWTRDGRRVVYMSRVPGRGYSRLWDQNSTEEPLWKTLANEASVGPKGGYWAFRVSVRGNNDIVIAPAESLDATRPVAQTPAQESMPRLSPNGRLLAYTSDETGRTEIFVQPIPGPGPRIAVSAGGGDEPLWSPDGATLFYRGPTRLMSATIAERPQLGVVKRDSLFVDVYDRAPNHQNFDIFPNGREFLMLRSGSSRADISVVAVINWQRGLGGTGRP